MTDGDGTELRAGRNIAMKVPPHQFEATVGFYRDVVGLPYLEACSSKHSECFAFGSIKLWIDRVEHFSQAEIWLEIESDDTVAAARRLEAAGVVRCDEIERLPAMLDGFWITNPAGIVHLVDNPDGDRDMPDTAYSENAPECLLVPSAPFASLA